MIVNNFQYYLVISSTPGLFLTLTIWILFGWAYDTCHPIILHWVLVSYKGWFIITDIFGIVQIVRWGEGGQLRPEPNVRFSENKKCRHQIWYFLYNKQYFSIVFDEKITWMKLLLCIIPVKYQYKKLDQHFYVRFGEGGGG